MEFGKWHYEVALILSTYICMLIHTNVPAFIRQNVTANCKRSTKWQMSLSIFNWSLPGLDAQLVLRSSGTPIWSWLPKDVRQVNMGI